MKFNIKSKEGFTLIELLVVIGILAVLAAIAIPSVAGLIDRANVSADSTNSNEMTNALERFASEYELYCQDIASGVVTDTTTNFDSAQGRVFNVTGATTRADIQMLEVAQDAVVEDDQIAIYRDTKYPANVYTAQLIIQNYTKTSSSTFEPKQSDMHYWYSPDCGVVVFATPNATVGELNALIQSGMDAKGNPLGNATQWVDLTVSDYESAGNNQSNRERIPAGAKYIRGLNYYNESGERISFEEACKSATIYKAGDYFPETTEIGDIYTYGDYQYCYGYEFCNCFYTFSFGCCGDERTTGWGVGVSDQGKTSYGTILSNIRGIDVTSMNMTFESCANLRIAPQIPETIKSLSRTFDGCYALERAPKIPAGVTNMYCTFYNCISLEGIITVDANPIEIEGCFEYTEKSIILNGSSTKLNELAQTATNGNITVG